MTRLSIMKSILLLTFLLHVTYCDERALPEMSVPELIRYWGYPVEEHFVTTEDGYILGMHRIPHGKDGPSDNSSKPVIFMAHCLVCNSGEFVFGPPEKSLGYILADEGYDVWMGNTRGNSYSKNHVSFDACPKCPDFWNFGFDDSGVKDYKAEVDHILETTNQEKLHFIGHSMGTTQFIIFLSELPEYNDKIIDAYLMGPAVFMTSADNPIFTIASWANNIEILYHLFGFYEFLPHYELITWIGQIFCDVEGNTALAALCENIVFIFSGINEAQLNMTMMPTYLEHVPDGSSTRPFVHYAQLHLTDYEFRKYDFGSEEANLNHYGVSVPPAYNLNNVKVPVALFVGDKDDLACVDDVMVLADRLPNVSLLQVVDFEGWTHLDFSIAIDADKLVYRKIVDMINAYYQ